MESDNLKAAGAARRTDMAFPLIAAFLGVSRIWVAGYGFGGGDQSWQIPLVRGLASGEMLKDYIFSPAPRLSFFFPLVALVVKVWPADVVFFAGYLAASVATAAALYLLAARMLESRPAALLAVVMLMVGKDVAAGATTWDAAFLPRTAAMPLMLFSFYYLLKGRPAVAGVFMGFTFALHPLTGVYTGVIAAAAIVVAEVKTWQTLWRFGLGAAFLVAATLLYARGQAVPIWSAPAAWYQAMVVRNLNHLAYGNLFVLAGLLVYGLFAAMSVGLSGGRARLLFGAIAVCAVVFMYTSGAQVVAHFLDLEFREIALMKPPIIAVLQPLRISGPLGILILVATAGMLWRAMQKGLVVRLSAIGAAVALALAHYAIGVVLVASSLLAQRQSRASRTAAVALALAALTAAAVSHWEFLILTSAVMVASVVAAFAWRNTRFSAASATLLAIVVLLGFVPVDWAARAAVSTFGREASDVDSRYLRDVEIGFSGETALLEAGAWIRAHAAPDEVSIVPPWWASFRVAAERPVYGTYKDGTLVFFNAALASEWMERMSALHVPLGPRGASSMPDEARLGYSLMVTEDVVVAARLHPARYVVRMEDDLPGLPTVYSGAHCCIYEIPPQEGAQ